MFKITFNDQTNAFEIKACEAHTHKLQRFIVESSIHKIDSKLHPLFDKIPPRPDGFEEIMSHNSCIVIQSLEIYDAMHAKLCKIIFWKDHLLLLGSLSNLREWLQDKILAQKLFIHFEFNAKVFLEKLLHQINPDVFKLKSEKHVIMSIGNQKRSLPVVISLVQQEKIAAVVMHGYKYKGKSLAKLEKPHIIYWQPAYDKINKNGSWYMSYQYDDNLEVFLGMRRWQFYPGGRITFCPFYHKDIKDKYEFDVTLHDKETYKEDTYTGVIKIQGIYDSIETTISSSLSFFMREDERKESKKIFLETFLHMYERAVASYLYDPNILNKIS